MDGRTTGLKVGNRERLRSLSQMEVRLTKKSVVGNAFDPAALRAHLHRRGLQQGEFAELCGISRIRITQFLSGHARGSRIERARPGFGAD